MDVNQAIELLQKTVKYSAVPGQKHLDMTLVGAEEREQYQKALVAVNKAIESGEITQEEFKRRVGLL